MVVLGVPRFSCTWSSLPSRNAFTFCERALASSSVKTLPVFGFVRFSAIFTYAASNAASAWMWTWPSAFVPALCLASTSLAKNGLASSASSTSLPVLCAIFGGAAAGGSRISMWPTARLPTPLWRLRAIEARKASICGAWIRASRSSSGSVATAGASSCRVSESGASSRS